MRLTARIPFAIAVLALASVIIPGGPASAFEAKSYAQQISPAGDPVDINTATLDQLTKVPGLTRTWAARIIRFRPYRAKNELLDRGVVTSRVYDRIKDHIIAHRIRNN